MGDGNGQSSHLLFSAAAHGLALPPQKLAGARDGLANGIAADGREKVGREEFAFAAVVKTLKLGSMTLNETALEDARRAGFDLDLLDSNLALTPEERALRHDSALELVLALREARLTINEKPAFSPAEIC